MKNRVIFISVVIAIVTAAVGAVFLIKLMRVTDPYVVSPIAVTSAPAGATRGHTVDSETHILSVFSDAPVVVVADPGVSFQYEVLWIIVSDDSAPSGSLREYRFAMPEYANAENVNSIDAEIPENIRAVAANDEWR